MIESIAVRSGSNGCLGCEIATSPSSIFDNELLAKSFRQPLTDQTGMKVVGAARGKPNKDARRPHRVALRASNPRNRRQRGGAGGQLQKLPAVGTLHGITEGKALGAVRMPDSRSLAVEP